MSIGLSHVEDLANEINELHDRIKQDHLQIAEKALKGSQGLSSKLKKELHRQLKMDKTKFSRYVFIGRRLPELRPIEQHLPGGYSLMDAIARLSVTERDAALAAGVINPKMTRAQLKAWKAKRAGKEKPNREEHRTLSSVAVNPKLLSRQVLKRMCDDLDSFQARYAVMSQVKLNCDPSDDELDTSWKKPTRYVVQEVKRIVDAERKRAYKKALQAYGQKKLTEKQKREAFGYVPDEVDLDGNSDEEDAKRVLDTIGRMDEFEPICRKADDLYDPGAVQERKMKLFAQKGDEEEEPAPVDQPNVMTSPKRRPSAEEKRKPNRRAQRKATEAEGVAAEIDKSAVVTSSKRSRSAEAKRKAKRQAAMVTDKAT